MKDIVFVKPWRDYFIPDSKSEIRMRYIESMKLAYNRNREDSQLVLSHLYPPLELLYLAGYAKDNGFSVEVFDLEYLKNLKQKTETEIIKLIESRDANIYAFSSYSSNYHIAKKIADHLKRTKESINIIGGPHTFFSHEEIMNDKCFDFSILYEGEDSLVKLLENIDCVDETIPNLVFKKDGKIIKTKLERFDINKRSLPSYESLVIKEAPNKVYSNAPITTSSGCPFQCVFCTNPLKELNSTLTRNPLDVLDEISFVNQKYKFNNFDFFDETLTFNKDHFRKLSSNFENYDLDINCSATSRIDCIDKEILGLMKKMNFSDIFYGIESGDNVVLNKIKKNITIENAMNVCEKTKNTGIKVGTYWMFGNPFETKESAQATIKAIDRMFNENLIDFADPSIVMPWPGTEIAEFPERFNVRIFTKDYRKYNTEGYPIMDNGLLTREEIFSFYLTSLDTISKQYFRLYGVT